MGAEFHMFSGIALERKFNCLWRIGSTYVRTINLLQGERITSHRITLERAER
jgi:hypothetical protein